MGIQIFPAAGGTANFSGLFIPRSDLQAGGLSADSELADAVAANIKRDKAIYAFGTLLAKAVSVANVLDKLGLTSATPDLNAVNHVFGGGGQKVFALNGSTAPSNVPLPSTGTNAARGDFALAAVFPNIEKVTSAATISEAGLLIESASLARYGGAAHGSIGVTASDDNRAEILAFYLWIANDTTTFPTRSTTAPSAITTRAIGTPSRGDIPAAYTRTNDPTSGLSNSDLDVLVLLTWANSTVTFETTKTLTSDGLQSWEVNSVAS